VLLILSSVIIIAQDRGAILDYSNNLTENTKFESIYKGKYALIIGVSEYDGFGNHFRALKPTSELYRKY